MPRFLPAAVLFSTALLARPGAAQAQRPASPADTARQRQLGEVTVYATRLSQLAGQSGRYVTVVPGSALSRYPVASLDDLLRLLPALEVQSRGNFGTQADITLRGSTFNQVLILLDGMRLNDPLTGHFAGYFPIAPTEIEQIEVVRGPGAALYGPDAVGGFINIVTKTFAATHRPDGAELAGTFLAGEYGLKSTNAGFYGQDKGLRLAGGILNNTASGQLLDLPGGGRNDFKLNTYSLSGAYQISDKLSAAARASFDRRDYNAQNFYTTATGDRARETTSRDWYQGQLRYEWNERARTELQIVGTASTDLYLYTPTSVASDHLMHYLNVQGQHQLQLSDHVRLSLGGQADRRAVQSNDRGDHAVWHTGAFAVAALAPAAGLNLTAALRVDHDQSYGTEVVPQLNASQQVGERLTVRGAVGRGIRAPNFTEQYNSAIRPGTVPSGFNVGNPGLSAERTINYEGGLDYQPLAALTLRGTYFNRYGRNLIDYVSQPGSQVIEGSGFTNLNPAATYRFAQNLFAVRTQGIETEVTTRAQLAPGLRLDGSVGYTWVSLNTEGDVQSQYLSNVARHLVSGNVSLTHRRFTLAFGGLYKVRAGQSTTVTTTNGQLAATLTPSYAVFNARLDLALVPERVWLVGQAQNLFNAQYSDLLGAPMPTRWLMAGVRVALRK
ncbi:TonB-dependent receptor plug domain-containing protein [Hymenobacter cheonanensis]|uniref:TonB-dependent receptor plug domain-containing protein n=1 Tax=Hymenobacter sp. CA2-7 TaxID=3063993 RepID=UPI002714159E|nr:TonB-dependent receptor [Hymenobacter sp. CA2-7]MDO7886692.1 TonB-dependent receptor [Hymenobacter sp. CA2-7]